MSENRKHARAVNNGVFGFVALTLVGCIIMRAVGSRLGEFTVRTESFTSNGRPVAVEVYSPKAPGKHPVIVFVHGADGLQGELFRAYYRQYAQEMAARGYVVVFPHYMESTGTKAGMNAEMFKNFRTWMQTVGDATTYASTLPDADPDRIGLMGISLGASLVICQGAVDPRIRAVVEMSGALPIQVQPKPGKRVPAVLILHGARDPLVNVNEAYRLEKTLKEMGATYEMHIYDRQGHGFIGPAHADSVSRIAEFFGKHLATSVRLGNGIPG